MTESQEKIEPEKITQKELQEINFEKGEKVHIFSAVLDWSALSKVTDRALEKEVKISFSNHNDQGKAFNRIFHII